MILNILYTPVHYEKKKRIDYLSDFKRQLKTNIYIRFEGLSIVIADVIKSGLEKWNRSECYSKNDIFTCLDEGLFKALECYLFIALIH